MSAWAAAVLLAGLSAPALAAGTMTVPTELTLDDCTVVSTNDFETLRACPGYKGIPVMLKGEKQQVAVSYGLASTTEKAASQFLPEGYLPEGEIDWRISNREGGWKAFAAILRFAAQDTNKPDVLVVTRIAPGNTCILAYVDAKANPDAMALAEAAADQHGFDFDCARDQPAKPGKFAAW